MNSETEEEIIKKALEKSNKKRAKKGLPPQKITNAAHLSTKTLAAEEQEAKARAEEAKRKQAERNKETQEKIKNSTAYYNENAKPGIRKHRKKSKTPQLTTMITRSRAALHPKPIWCASTKSAS